MASPALVPSIHYRRLSLAAIDAVVSARLGPTRIQGNAQPACFNRQVAMYLAKHVAGWSTTCIGRFYNGRDHSTVIHGIQRIQALRDTVLEVDALLSHLKNQLAGRQHEEGEKKVLEGIANLRNASFLNVDELAEAIVERVWSRIEQRFLA
jgi:hypothetical protein